MGCRYAKRFFLVFDVRDIYIDMSFNITSNIVFEITPFLDTKNSVFLYNGTVDMQKGSSCARGPFWFSTDLIYMLICRLILLVILCLILHLF